MFVKNFYMCEAVRLSGVDQTSGDYPLGYSSAKKKVDYFIGTGTLTQSGIPFTPQSNSDHLAAGVYFGTGDAQVSFNDHFISGDFIDGLSAVCSKEVEFTEIGNIITATFTIQNPTDEDVTIREVAIFKTVNRPGTSSSAFYIMIERTVLTTPVTILANGVGQVTYKIRMDYPIE